MKICIPFLFFIFINVSFCQITNLNRFEVEQNEDSYFCTVVPSGELGLVVFQETDEYNKGNVWRVFSLDTTLTECWNKDIVVKSKFIFKGYDLRDGVLYLVFREGEYKKGDYHIISLNINNGYQQRFDIQNEFMIDLSDIKVVSDRMFFAGRVNNIATIISYQFGKNEFEVVSSYYYKKSKIVDLRVNKNNTFNVTTIESDYLGSSLRLRVYNYEGIMLFEKKIFSEIPYRFLNAKSSNFINGDLIVSGVYSFMKSNYSVGIFLAILKPSDKETVIRYYPFSEFHHFFNYLRPKKAERVKNKIKNRIEKIKNPRISIHFFVDEVKNCKEGYLITGGVFNPEYVTSSQKNGIDQQFAFQKNWQRMNPFDQRYIDYDNTHTREFQYSKYFKQIESVTIVLENNGKIKWDMSLQLNDYKTKTIKNLAYTSVKDTTIFMITSSEDLLKMDVMNKKDSLIKNFEEQISLKYDNDKVTYTYEDVGGNEHWYDNNFIFWGIHKIENKEDMVDNKYRRVLYVNKLRLE